MHPKYSEIPILNTWALLKVKKVENKESTKIYCNIKEKEHLFEDSQEKPIS